MRTRSAITFCSYLVLFSAAALGQSKYAPIFERLQRTGDRNAFWKEMFEANRGGINFQVEVPALLHVISSNADALSQEQARGQLCNIAFDHPLAYNIPIEREVFRPVVAVFEGHLDEALKDENSHWRPSIVALTAYLGFPPNPQALALMYQMVDDKDTASQGIALLGLARLKPIPPEAKKVLFSRLTKTKDKASGPAILEMLAYGIATQPGSPSTIDDTDVLDVFLKSAEGEDANEQDKATQFLSRLTPIPKPAIELFRRLQQRKDLSTNVAANVKGAIDRIENRVPVENKD